MKVVVIGLGYVGSVCAACLARDGFDVIGIDVNAGKVEAVQSGRSPVLEPGLSELMAEARRHGRLRAASHVDADAREAGIFLLCVGTPSSANGSSDLSHLERALTELADAIRGVEEFQVVVIRSTVPPGTISRMVIPLLEKRSGRRVGEQLGVAMNPEFLREGTSIRDYDSAPFDLCGTSDPRTQEIMRRLYEGKARPFEGATLETAEMVKYVNNAFHALKIAFANEVGRVAKRVGVDSTEVMRLLCQDRKLNISPAYLQPGMAFGGSCLPKDLRALVYEARRSDVAVPLMEAILSSNDVHLQSAIDVIVKQGRAPTAILGLSFKAGTDDLRESPMVRLVEALIGKGIPVRIYDRNVRLSALVGSNREYIEREIPHIASLLVESLPRALEGTRVIVVGTDDQEIDALPSLLRNEQIVLDLFGRLARAQKVKVGGICW